MDQVWFCVLFSFMLRQRFTNMLILPILCHASGHFWNKFHFVEHFKLPTQENADLVTGSLGDCKPNNMILASKQGYNTPFPFYMTLKMQIYSTVKGLSDFQTPLRPLMDNQKSFNLHMSSL